MTDDADAWAVALKIPSDEAAEFDRLTASMGSSPPEILKMMVDRVLQMERKLGAYGLPGISGWGTAPEAVEALVDHAVHGLPIDIRASCGPPTSRFLGRLKNARRRSLDTRSNGTVISITSSTISGASGRCQMAMLFFTKHSYTMIVFGSRVRQFGSVT
jgi:hypothetical protein